MNRLVQRKIWAGFTLLEVLLVVAIIAILAVIVIVAINPGRQLAQARNAERRSDVRTILDAIKQYSIDNGGFAPTTIANTLTEICATSNPNCGSLVDLSVLTTGGKYLSKIPADPRDHCSAGGVCYEVLVGGDCVKVVAPGAELGETIEVMR